MTTERHTVKRSCVMLGAIVLNVLVWLGAVLPNLPLCPGGPCV